MAEFGQAASSPMEKHGALIFDQLNISADQLRRKVVFDQEITEDRITYHGVSGFELPGRMPRPELDKLQIKDGVFHFPNYGAWDVVSAYGVFKALLLKPGRSATQEILDIAGFVAQSAQHCGRDTYLCYDGQDEFFRLAPIMDKLNFSDQPLGLWCGESANVLAHILMVRGFICRSRSLQNPNSVGHTFMECYAPDREAWLYLDTDFGVALKHDGEFLSADDVVNLRLAERHDEIEIVDIGNRYHIIARKSYNLGFFGQRTWSRSEENIERSLAHDPYYRDIVLRDGFHGLTHQAYLYTRDGNNIYRLAETI